MGIRGLARKMLRTTVRETRLGFTYLVDRLIPLRMPEPKVKSVQEIAAVRSGSPVCLVATFSDDSILTGNFVEYLRQLKDLGFQNIVVTTSLSLPESEVVKLSSVAAVVIHRENRGYDFFSWKEGFRYLAARNIQPEGILVANDSVLLLKPGLESLWRRIGKGGNAIVGAVDSWHYGHHLPSYFVFYPPQICQDPRVIRSFLSIRELRNKRSVIRLYEVGFSRKFSRWYPLRSVWSVEEIRKKAPDVLSPNVNLATGYWYEMIQDHSFVFLKKSVAKRCLEKSDPRLHSVAERIY